ncbi:MAG: AAA family ATPase [Dehalococcoidia bacterium]|nr:AAA family ATPase [Dehalococcoidia bacterium]
MARGLTPFVGRQNDVRQLIRCFDLAMKGQGQVVGIVGEAGVGKSRLLRQMIESLPPDQFLYLEGECLHYGETVPYFPMLSILKSYFGIEESDAPSAAIKKVQQKIRQLDGQLETMTGAMCDLLSLNVEDSEYASLKPQEKRERAFEAIKTLLLRESRNQPLLIVIEDLQWIDRTSEEFLGQMIPRLPGAPIMLVLLYRPEYVHPWTSKAHYTQIRVDEMSPETSADMVEAILKGGIVTPELKQLILSHGLGNPLFIEEFIRTLIEKGHIRWSNGSYILTPGTGQMQVPETIEGIISSRIDNLKDSVKKTLQVSSVVGREFSAAVLQMTMGMSAGIKEALDELQELELIYEKNLFPETEYTFKHALTQDVAYNSLLIRSRRVIHQKVGRAIETLYPQRREELCETLAHHYSKAEDMEKAYEYSKLSGDKAYRNSSMSEALRRYREALAMLDHLPDTERNKVRALELTVLAWQPMLALGFREGSLDILKKGQRLAEELGDKRRLTQLYGFMAHYLSYTGDSVQGYEYAGKALAEAERTGDIESAVWAATNFIGPVVYRGDFAQAASVSARAVDLIEKAGEAHRRIGHGIPLYPTLIAVNGLATGMLGEFKQGEPLCERIVRVAAESGDASVMAVAEVICGLISAVRGKDIAACQKHLQDAIHYSQQSGFGAWLALAWTCLGWSHWLQGTLQPAWDCAQKAISIYSETEQRVMLSLAHLLVGAISLDSADVPNALNSTEEALKLSQACGEKHVEGRASCWHGRVLSMADVSCRTAAEEEILRGIDLLAEMRIRPWQAEGHLLAGEHYLAAGDQPKALSRLTKAQGMFQEMEMTHWLARAQRALAAIPGADP